ncbi:Small RNA 2'-O-methyltransferase [Gonapodya sp. JEL0774]|nr:Small RNA 2'-O-methyltransferase [Gonapodya sp. JEL0774]
MAMNPRLIIPHLPGVRFDPPLWQQRQTEILRVVNEFGGIEKLLELGCGECRLIHTLHNSCDQRLVVGVDLRADLLREASDLLKPISALLGTESEGFKRIYGAEDDMRERETEVRLFGGDMTKPDSRLLGFDCIVATEVIEHLDPPEFAVFPKVMLGYYRPKLCFVSTPNKDYNVLFPGNADGLVRDPDHSAEHGYSAALGGIGRMDGVSTKNCVLAYDPEIGHCTQFAVFWLPSPTRDLLTPSDTVEDVTATTPGSTTPGQCSHHLEAIATIRYPCHVRTAKDHPIHILTTMRLQTAFMVPRLSECIERWPLQKQKTEISFSAEKVMATRLVDSE